MIGFDDSTPPPAAPRPLTHRSLVSRAIHSMGWLSRLLFVLFYLEVGFALLVVPWSMFWDRNYFAQTLPAINSIITNDFVRGAVSGLGLVNIGVGISELVAMLLARHHESDVTTLRPSAYEDQVRAVVCMVTDRRRGGAEWRSELPRQVAAAARAGVDLVQVRERDLEGGALFTLVRDCVGAVAGTSTRVVVNDRLDVALAAGAHGVHLRSDTFAAPRARAMAGPSFVIGRSVHSADEAGAVTDQGGLDYLLFGTVFETASKPGRAAAGLDRLRQATAATSVPVLAIGGITLETIEFTAAAGAAGIAAIGLFSGCPPDEMDSLTMHIRYAFDSQRARSLT